MLENRFSHAMDLELDRIVNDYFRPSETCTIKNLYRVWIDSNFGHAYAFPEQVLERVNNFQGVEGCSLFSAFSFVVDEIEEERHTLTHNEETLSHGINLCRVALRMKNSMDKLYTLEFIQEVLESFIEYDDRPLSFHNFIAVLDDLIFQMKGGVLK